MNKNKFVKENFRLLEEKDSLDGRKIRIFTRNSGIGEIPHLLKEYVYDSYSNLFIDEGGWKRGNCDMGIFDAVMAIHPVKKYIDVYICGIIRRPFTEDESNQYELYFKGSMDYRLTTVFDNHYNKEVKGDGRKNL